MLVARISVNVYLWYRHLYFMHVLWMSCILYIKKGGEGVHTENRIVQYVRIGLVFFNAVILS